MIYVEQNFTENVMSVIYNVNAFVIFDRCTLYNKPVSKKLIFVVSVDTSV